MEFSYLHATLSITDVLKDGSGYYNLTHIQQLGTTAEELRQRLITAVDTEYKNHNFDYDDMTAIHISINKITNAVDEESGTVNYQLEGLVNDVILFEEYLNSQLSQFFEETDA